VSDANAAIQAGEVIVAAMTAIEAAEAPEAKGDNGVSLGAMTFTVVKSASGDGAIPTKNLSEATAETKREVAYYSR
jgi:hypothetical protein